MYVYLNVSHLTCILSLFKLQQVHTNPEIKNPRRKPIKAPITESTVAVDNSWPSSSVFVMGLTSSGSILVLEAIEDYK